MKITLISLLILTTSTTWANTLFLNCTINHQEVNIDVDSLISDDSCKSGTILSTQEESKTRYKITLCNQNQATGSFEVQNTHGDWIEVDTISTEKNCTLFRKITNTVCRPVGYGHNSGC